MIVPQLENYTDLLDNVLSKIKALEIDIPLICDHICYRVESYEEYHQKKKAINKFAEMVGETIVSNRPIAIFKLDSPIKYQSLNIDCIELPAPKENRPYLKGWEHAEFVIEDLDKLIRKNTHIAFDKTSIKREINPELAWKVSDNQQIKFHPKHILDVLKIEKKRGITHVI